MCKKTLCLFFLFFLSSQGQAAPAPENISRTYNPDSNGIDFRIERFSPDQKRLALLYIAALEEIFSVQNIQVLGQIESRMQYQPLANFEHFFDQTNAEALPFHTFLAVYTALFPDLQAPLRVELQKIDTMGKLEEISQRYRIALQSQNISREEIMQLLKVAATTIKDFPGQSTEAVDFYRQERDLQLDSSIQTLRHGLAFEVRLNQILKSPPSLLFAEAQRVLSRIENDIVWESDRPFVVWTKLVPIVQSGFVLGGLRTYPEYLSQLPISRIEAARTGLVRVTDEAILQVFVSDRETFVTQFLEQALPLNAVKAIMTFKAHNRRADALRILNALRAFLEQHKPSLSPLSIENISRALTIGSLWIGEPDAVKAHNAKSVADPSSSRLMVHDYEGHIQIQYGSKVLKGSSVSKMLWISDNDLENQVARYQLGSMTHFAQIQKRTSYSFSSNCNGYKLKSNSGGLLSHHPEQVSSPVQCEGYAITLRNFENQFFLGGITVKPTRQTRFYFENILGFVENGQSVSPWRCWVMYDGRVKGLGTASTREEALRLAQRNTNIASTNMRRSEECVQ